MITQEAEATKQEDIIIHGSTWAAIWHMSWPLLINMATISVASFADVWVAGKLGADSLAAIGIGGQIGFFMIMLAVALSSGTTALVSRFWGARDYQGAIEASRQSLVFALIFGTFSCTAGFLFSKIFLHFLGASPKVEQLGWDYLKTDLLSHIPFTWVANSIFRAKGNARVPMITWALMTVSICSLDYVLCLWPFHLGICGIGISWLISGTLGLAFSLGVLKCSDLKECLNFNTLAKTGLSKEWIMRLLRIGIPACIQDLAWVGGNMVLLLILARCVDATSAQASWAVGLRVEEMVGGMPIYALSMAVATIVGQNLGARRSDRAEAAGWQCAIIGGVFNLTVGLILFMFAEPLAGMMCSEPRVIDYTRQYFQIVGLAQPFVALWLILFGAMSGAGYTKWPMWASAICLTGIRLPLAWILTVSLAMGPEGTWWSLAISSFVVGVVAVWRFRTGVWKQQKI